MPGFVRKSAPVNWDALARLDVDEIQRKARPGDGEEDDDYVVQLEDAFEWLVHASLTVEDAKADPARTVRLFRAMQLAAEAKHLQLIAADTALDKCESDLKLTQRQLDDVRRAQTMDVKSQQLLQEKHGLYLEISALEDKLAEKQRLLDRMRVGAGGDPADLQNENDALQSRVRGLEDQVRSLEDAVEKERQQAAKLQAELTDWKDRVRDTERERDRLNSDVADYRQQIEGARAANVRRGEEEDLRAQVRQKNTEIGKYLREIQALSSENADLDKRFRSMRDELESAIKEMDAVASRSAQLQKALDDADKRLDDAAREREILISQVDDLTEQLHERGSADEGIMRSLEQRVAEWTELLQAKEAELGELRRLAAQQKATIAAQARDLEGTPVYALQKANSDKDEVIRVLRDQLATATKALEEYASRPPPARKADSTASLAEIEALKAQLAAAKADAADADKRQRQAEENARARDSELVAALARMQEYERGTYGLYEAVQEIKERKAQIAVRDNDVAALTKEVNALTSRLDDVVEENEELRRRLGLEPRAVIDLADLRQKKAVELEQLRAVNRELSREIDRLEEERLQMKARLRHQALQRGERAVELGLHADDLLAVEQYADSLKEGRDERPTPSRSERMRDSVLQDRAAQSGGLQSQQRGAFSTVEEGTRLQMAKFADEVKDLTRQVAKLGEDRGALSRDVTALRQENELLKAAAAELAEAAKTAAKSAGTAEIRLKTDALDRVIDILQAKQAYAPMGAPGLSASVSRDGGAPEIERLRGANEELRAALNATKKDLLRAVGDAERRAAEADALRKQVEMLKSMDAPAGKAPLSAGVHDGTPRNHLDVIATLNEQLTDVLAELAARDAKCKDLEDGLEGAKRSLSVALHQQGLLYQEHMAAKQAWADEKTKVEETAAELRVLREQDAVRIEEFERMRANLEKSPKELEARLGDLVRQVTVLRVNEKSLVRRHLVTQEVETALRRENTRLKTTLTQMDAAMRERAAHLQRLRDAASYRAQSLQAALDEAVPMRDLESLNRKFDSLAAKYRDLLEKDHTRIENETAVAASAAEVRHLRDRCELLERELELVKEARAIAEASIAGLKDAQQGGDGGGRGHNEIFVLRQRIATLEMTGATERERAELCARRLEQAERLSKDFERRNADLEARFAELTRMCGASQESERQLRAEMDRAVPREEADRYIARIAELEKKESENAIEIGRLKEVAEAAIAQTSAVQAMQRTDEAELQSLRNQVLELQSQGDEGATIGRLHHQLVAFQVSEGVALRKLERAESETLALRQALMRLERRVYEREEQLFHFRLAARQKTRHVQRQLEHIRQQYSGAVTLDRQERATQALAALDDKRRALQSEVNTLRAEKAAMEDRVAEAKMIEAQMDELKRTIAENRQNERILEWHQKISDARLESLRATRRAVQLSERERQLETELASAEALVAGLEADLVARERASEERQLAWEHREYELEGKIETLEKEREELRRAAARVEEETGAVPDPSLPVSHQLEHALRKLKDAAQSIAAERVQGAQMRQRLDALEELLGKEKQSGIERDKEIARLRMTAVGAEADARLRGTGVGASGDGLDDVYRHAETNAAALRAAQEAVVSLRTLLAQKEEALSKYQDMLRAAREDAQAERDRHLSEVKELTERLQRHADDSMKRLREKAAGALNRTVTLTGAGGKTSADRIAELEEVISEQEHELHALGGRMKRAETAVQAAQAEARAARDAAEKDRERMRDERERLVSEHLDETQKLRNELGHTRHELQERNAEMDVMRRELEEAKDMAARGPSGSMKALVQRLRTELATKEKQQEALGRILAQLKGEMTSSTRENAEGLLREAGKYAGDARGGDGESEAEGARELASRVTDLQRRMERMRGELERQRETEAQLRLELERRGTGDKTVDAEVRRMKRTAKEAVAREQAALAEVERLRARMEGNEHVQELEKKIKVLQARLGERGGDEGLDEPDGVARWESDKKWQRKVDLLKTRLGEKTRELEEAERKVLVQRDTIARLEKERARLQARAGRQGSSTSINEASPAVVGEWATAGDLMDAKARIHALEDENAALRRECSVDKDGELKRLAEANDFLRSTVAALELEVESHSTARASGGGIDAFLADELRVAKESVLSLQARVLDLEKENLALRFDVEQANIDLPRLRNRAADLERYVAEVCRPVMDAADKWRKEAMAKDPKRVELEGVVDALKRLVERLQRENDSLKKQVSGAANPDAKRLQRRVEELEARAKAGGPTTEGDAARQAEKARAENERLLRRVKREEEERARVQRDLALARAEREEIDRKIADLARIVGAKTHPLPSLGGDEGDRGGDGDAGLDAYRTLRSITEKYDELKGAFETAGSALGDCRRQLDASRAECDELQRRVAELQSQGRGARSAELAERVASLEKENASLRRELSAFDPAFFEELEDLKYSHKEALKKVAMYEKRLGIRATADAASGAAVARQARQAQEGGRQAPATAHSRPLVPTTGTGEHPVPSSPSTRPASAPRSRSAVSREGARR